MQLDSRHWTSCYHEIASSLISVISHLRSAIKGNLDTGIQPMFHFQEVPFLTQWALSANELTLTCLLGSPAVTLVGEYILAVCCIFKNHTSAWWEADFIVIVLGGLEATLRASIQFVLRFFSPGWRSKTFQITEHRAVHTLFFLTEFPLSHLAVIPSSDSSLLACIFILTVFMNIVHRELAGC